MLNPYAWPADVPQFLRLRATLSPAPLLISDAPQMIRARTISPPLGLELHWADRSNAELGYRIERQRAAEGWELFGITGPDTIFYPDHTVQSGTAYAYRVRALFAEGQFSAWSGSGSAIPAQPGGPGGGDPGGGGPPDPDPDTDEDTFRDSVDAYPHDSRRSRDLPVMTYVALDVSSAVTSLDVEAVALDELNTVAFAYEDATSLYSAAVRDGQPVANAALTVTKEHTVTYDETVADPNTPGQTITVTRSATGAYSLLDPSGSLLGGVVNAAGHLAGVIRYIPAEESDTFFERPFVATGNTPTDILPPPNPSPGNHLPGIPGGDYCWQAGFLGNSDKCFAGFYDGQTCVGDGTGNTWYSPPWQAMPGAESKELYLGISSFGGLAAGYFYADTASNGPMVYPSFASLGNLSPLAINDSGTVLGHVGGTYQPMSYMARSTDGGAPLTAALPAVYAKQVRFPAASRAWLNNQGDIVIAGAHILEGPEDAPAWAGRTVLWRKATDELFVLTLPDGVDSLRQFNNAGCFSAIATVPILDADGNPILDGNGNPAFRDVAQLVVPVEFVTKGKNDAPKFIDGFFNGTPAPVIEAIANNCTVLPGRIVSLNVSGTIKDATSDLIDTPAKQLQTITVKWPGGSAVSNLENSAAPELPWKPYKFESNFSQAVSFVVTGPGYYPIEIQTSENASGEIGLTQQTVIVDEIVTNIVLAGSLDPAAPDALRLYQGSQPLNDASEVMEETGASSQIFQFEANDDSFKAELLSDGVLTAAVDTISVRLSNKISPGVFAHRDLAFVETGTQTNQFVFKELVASCGALPKSHPGTFLPVINRFPVNSLLEAPDIRIKTMDREWKLKKKDFGDGEYLYLVDDQDKAIVFNPSANAHTHIQTKPVKGDWTFAFFKDLDELGVTKLKEAEGLLIRGQEAGNFLGDSLIADTYARDIYRIGDFTFYNYHPKRNAQNQPLPVQRAGNANNSTKEEILWKYVTAKNKVILFDSGAALERDVTYRKFAVAAARSARFAYIGDGTPVDDNGDGLPDRGQKRPKFNQTLWILPGRTILDNEIQDRGALTSAHIAMQNIFTFTNSPVTLEYDGSMYAFACAVGANAVASWAAAQTLGKAVYDAKVSVAPFLNCSEVLEFRSQPDRAFWIPGDWGNIVNKSANPEHGREGENVIYLGGGLSEDFDTFKEQAQFWGLGMDREHNNIMKLREMLDVLAHWGTLEIDPRRVNLK